MNMGTPGNPEGLPHWSTRPCTPTTWNADANGNRDSGCFSRSVAGNAKALDLWKNILADVTAVKSEAEYGDFRPDILLERSNKPPIWLEITHTSPPSAPKLAFCAAHGIDVFELEGSQRPVDSAVRKAHISLRNCRQRQRQQLFDLWRHLESLDDPVVGIKEDFRSPERQRQEREASWAEWKERRQDVSDGKFRCARCDKPFTIQDGGFSLQFIQTHRPDGGCGEVPFCQECGFAVGGGWDGVYPDDAGSWGLDEECPACQPILADHARISDEVKRRRTLSMPAPYGRRLVHEPDRRQQSYIVGDKTVSRSELQSVLMMFKYVLDKVLPTHPHVHIMRNEVDKIGNAVQ